MRTIALFVFLVISKSLFSQELRCNISVNASQVQGTNKKVYQTMQTALYELLNNRAWTNHTYTVSELIECNILITISEQIGADEFKGSIQIQSRRPVFNSSYNTTLLNYKDDNIDFRYVEFEPLEFVESSHRSNLVALMAYYAYMILGYDYDSFSLEGGTEFFQKAEKIVNNAQSSNDIGWKAFDGKNNKNRYWLVKNMLDKRYAPLREFNYKYHREGLDIMDAKVIEGRSSIVEDFTLLKKVYDDRPDTYLVPLSLLLETKLDEFINIFSEGQTDEKSRVYNILIQIDGANSSKYQKIKG